MNIAELRYWLWKNNVRIYEERGQMKRHYPTKAHRLLETDEIRQALSDHRETLRAIAKSKCPTCGDPLDLDRQTGWSSDQCSRTPRHFFVGFQHDGKFIVCNERNNNGETEI